MSQLMAVASLGEEETRNETANGSGVAREETRNATTNDSGVARGGGD